MPAILAAIIHFFQMIIALIQVWGMLWSLVARGLMFSWPISLVLLAVLVSEFPHAPKKWENRFCPTLAPLGIQIFMTTWAVLSLVVPLLKFSFLGNNLGMAALGVQIVAAAYAWKKVDGYRCFFLALMLNELWIGYWSSLISGAIISRWW